jgi:hypothetical protein
VFLLGAGRLALDRGVDLTINWPGRIAVGPTMSAIFFALAGVPGLAKPLLYVGLALGYVAVVLYAMDARRQLAARAPSSSS